MSQAARDRLCRQLCQRGWLDCVELITRFGLTARGRTLLNLDVSVWPVTPDEKYILRSCQEHSITPGQVHRRVPTNQLQPLIEGLADQKLVRITQRRLTEVWLTPTGQKFLLEDYTPQGDTPAISLTLMNHYLQFMRQAIASSSLATEE